MTSAGHGRDVGSWRSPPSGRSALVSSLLGLTAGALLFSSCATDRDPGDLLIPQGVGTLVVSGVLVVGEPFPEIVLTRTLAPTSVFDLEAVVVRNVQTFHVQSVGDADEYQLVEYDEDSYWYQPVDTEAIVQPQTTYRLLVQTAEDEELVAVTTTPAEFLAEDWVLLSEDGGRIDQQLVAFEAATPPDSVYWENALIYGEGLLESRFDRPDVPGFQVAIESLDPDSDFAIDPDFFDKEDFEDLSRINSSPPLVAEDGSIRMPWFAISFQGRYKIKVFAMDRNWFDLARSLPEFGGGPGFGGQAGDDFERPIFHVQGGIGLFGSAAVDSIGFFVLPG